MCVTGFVDLSCEGLEGIFRLLFQPELSEQTLVVASQRKIQNMVIVLVRLDNRQRRKCFYISGVESVWALDFRFGPTKAEIDSSSYYLRALHCLGGTPGICLFMGIVTDYEDGLVKGFLARAPRRGPFFRQISRAKRSKKPVPWTRRENGADKSREPWLKYIPKAMR